jgi:putative hemolysin
VLHLLGSRAVSSPPVTEEEIRVLMAQGAEAGVFEAHENLLVSRVFRLDELRTAAIMTPRTDIVCLDTEDSREANLTRIAEAPHSLFPVMRGDVDRIEGIVAAKELLVDLVHEEPFDLTRHLRKPLYIPETLTATEVVRAFKQHRQTMALIVNEYGEFQGLVTLHDVLEALVGDIGPIDESEDPDIVARADGSLLIDGGVSVERFKQVLAITEDLPDEDTADYNTLAGFVMLQLGRIPRVADHFEWGGYRFEVVDMDRNRIDKLLISRLPPPN